MLNQNLIDQLGGEAAAYERLHRVVSDFYDRVFSDLMIGFYFKGKDKKRLIEKEVELALQSLGSKVPYSGGDLGKLHRPLKIFGGHFDRRLMILKETIQAHQLPEEVEKAWLDENRALRSRITQDGPGICHAE